MGRRGGKDEDSSCLKLKIMGMAHVVVLGTSMGAAINDNDNEGGKLVFIVHSSSPQDPT